MKKRQRTETNPSNVGPASTQVVPPPAGQASMQELDQSWPSEFSILKLPYWQPPRSAFRLRQSIADPDEGSMNPKVKRATIQIGIGRVGLQVAVYELRGKSLSQASFCGRRALSI
jgi:hypothetical protein